MHKVVKLLDAQAEPVPRMTCNPFIDQHQVGIMEYNTIQGFRRRYADNRITFVFQNNSNNVANVSVIRIFFVINKFLGNTNVNILVK